MDNKLQELTDKLYNEGLSKGKQEAEALKAAAAKESEQIISEARKEADRILEAARKEAEELRTRVEGDIRMASSQTISAIRQPPRPYQPASSRTWRIPSSSRPFSSP